MSTIALPVRLGSDLLTAVTTTKMASPIIAGAVYKPPALMEPTRGVISHINITARPIGRSELQVRAGGNGGVCRTNRDRLDHTAGEVEIARQRGIGQANHVFGRE
jgi:hypothetical protein